MPDSTRKRRRTGDMLTAEMLTQASATLTEIDWRLLHWLLRYPFQRADDLVVGVARWASRATVYRHLQGLEASALVESVLPGTSGSGKRLYHLSNLGLHVLARYLERPARELASEWQADEVGLLRLLPRLPTLLVLQDAVNGLVTGAAEVMTTQGRRPRLVRWTWQRDATHRFQYREQAIRLFTDGAVALCIRTQQGESNTLDHWYGLFLLFTELDDERLMRQRLERLLCWRESPERWPVYQHMPPVLILASSQRQREHWQRAGETAALKLRLEPLKGTLAPLPTPESAQVNPWRLAWRTLASDHPCHLRDLLKPAPLVAFLPSLVVEEGEGEELGGRSPPNTPVARGSPGRPTRLVFGNLTRRAACITRNDLKEREIISLLGLRLTPRHWSILHLLLAHPLLSDEELAGLLALQRKSVRCTLYMLHSLECLEPIVTSVGRRWHLCERGLHLIASANHFHIRNLAVVSGDETADGTIIMKQRGETWLLQHIQHTVGIYGFFTNLTQATRQQPDQELCWWETGAMCERRYLVGEQWCNLRPDALAGYHLGGQDVCFWLEWDRGTMNVYDLEIKFASYAHYLTSREWTREFPRVPLLVCVAPDISQERRIHRVAQVRLAHLPEMELWTTTEGLMNRSGSLAAIWWHCLPQRCRVVPPGGLQRRLLFDAIAGKTGE